MPYLTAKFVIKDFPQILQMEQIFFNLKKLIKTKLLASPDTSGILFLASLDRKRYSGWQEYKVFEKANASASRKN